MNGQFYVIIMMSTIFLTIHPQKYSTRIVFTKYGPLRGIIVHNEPEVEAFLGVPYATPPLGALRYMPPVTPSMWKTTRLADTLSTVCPQNLPKIKPNRTEALIDYSESRLAYLDKLLPLLANQSEDCLYLNLYVPLIKDEKGANQLLPCLVYVHGESYEWNSGNPYDGTILAANGRIIVVTVNFRLGILGFLKTGTKSSAQGNFGLMDLVASLHWLRENLPAFGGDPDKVTLMGHDTGAAIANFIAVSPVTKELLQHVIMISGSSLSPWALQKDPLAVKQKVAELTNCSSNISEDDLAPCLRTKSLTELLSIRLDNARFLPGFAPFVDGSVLQSSSSKNHNNALHSEMANFSERNLLFGVTSLESYLDLSASDIQQGCNETKRDKILRTYVRNCFYFHLNEIFSTLRNEYTDWEKPIQNPLNIRDSIMEMLSDGHTIAPLIRIGFSHSSIGGRTFFFHFKHQSTQVNFPQRLGSVRGEDWPFIFGIPLISDRAHFAASNYSESEVVLSKLLIYYLGNFVRNGNPNGIKRYELDKPPPFWDNYDTINQLYLELGNDAKIKSHYRGHKMSLWLNLIPQLHRAVDGDDLSMHHHHFIEEGPQYYDGPVRIQTLQKPPNEINIQIPSQFNSFTTKQSPSSTIATTRTTTTINSHNRNFAQNITDCPPLQNSDNVTNKNNNSLAINKLRKIANNHYQNYTTALMITIAIGCFLLLLNLLIFMGIYHRRTSEKKHDDTSSCKRAHVPPPKDSCCYQQQLPVITPLTISNEYEKSPRLYQSNETDNSLHLEALKCSPSMSNLRTIEDNIAKILNSDNNNDKAVQVSANCFTEIAVNEVASQTINQTFGILKSGTPTSLMKKRVQIQEISV